LLLDSLTSEVRWCIPDVMKAFWCLPNGRTAVGGVLDETGYQLLAFDLQAAQRRWGRKDGYTMTSILSSTPSGEHALTLEVEFEQFHYVSEVPHRISWMNMLSGERVGAAVVQVNANYRFLHVLADKAGSLGTWCIVEDTLHFTTPEGPALQPILTPGSRVVGAVSVKGNRIATASSDGIIRVWDPMRFDGVKATAPAPIRAIARSADRDVVIVRANAIQQRNIDSWDTRSNYKSGTAMLSAEIANAAIDSNGRWMAYLERNTIGISHQEMYLWPTEQLVLWDIAKASRVAEFSTKLAGGSQLECSHLGVAGDGSRVVFGVERETGGAAIVMWTPSARPELSEITVRPTQLCACALAPDGVTVAAGWGDGVIAVYSPTERRFRFANSNIGGDAPMRALTWSPDARFLAWACDDEVISIASVSFGSQPETDQERTDGLVARFHGDATRLAFSPDNSYLLAIGAKLVWHRVPDGLIIASLTLDAPFVDAAFLYPSVVVAGDRMGDLHLLNLRTRVAASPLQPSA
jgi:WD40 repeat protein